MREERVVTAFAETQANEGKTDMEKTGFWGDIFGEVLKQLIPKFVSNALVSYAKIGGLGPLAQRIAIAADTQNRAPISIHAETVVIQHHDPAFSRSAADCIPRSPIEHREADAEHAVVVREELNSSHAVFLTLIITWAVLYSVVVWLFLTAKFTPTFQRGEYEAMHTTMEVIGWVAVLGIVYFQLIRILRWWRKKHISFVIVGWVYFFLPAITFVETLVLWDPGVTPQQWWYDLRTWMIWVIALPLSGVLLVVISLSKKE